MEKDVKKQWLSTMEGNLGQDGLYHAHKSHATGTSGGLPLVGTRKAREAMEQVWLHPMATKSYGAGNRMVEEEPDEWRTCFERDRDRILHSTKFRRLIGKTQVFSFPTDHQRTRLTHSLEVAQIAKGVSDALRFNSTLTETIALGHDCGHGPGGHASETALSPYLEDGFNHAIFGADVTLAQLNLCRETLDGIRNHSWSLDAPLTLEGLIVSYADRIAYCSHDLSDALSIGVVQKEQVPSDIIDTVGLSQRQQISYFIQDLIFNYTEHQVIALSPQAAKTLALMRSFNNTYIYKIPEISNQYSAWVNIVGDLAEYFIEKPYTIPEISPNYMINEDNIETVDVIEYVAGMTDRFACRVALDYLGYNPKDLPIPVVTTL